ILLTATADRHITEDIVRHFPEVAEKTDHIRMSVARPEILLLSKRVHSKRQRMATLVRFLRRQARRPLPPGIPRRGIIFSLEAVDQEFDANQPPQRRDRMKANEVVHLLRKRGFSNVATFTSKGMSPEARAAAENLFDSAPARKGKLTAV